MPQVLPAAISALGAAAGGLFGATLIMYSTQIAAGLLLAGGLAYSASAKRKAERKARAAYNASQVDRLANVPGTIQPRALVLGRARVGGHVFFRGSTGDKKEKFVMAVALAGHEIDGIEQLWLNDQAITTDTDGWVRTEPYLIRRKESGKITGDVAPPEAIEGTVNTYTRTTGGSNSGTTQVYTSYQYWVETPKARIRAYLGADGQSADAQLMADFPGLWTAAHRAQGVAYLVCEFWYDETAFPSGLPSVTATIRGAKCFDPRTGDTRWTENPALHQRHVLTHPYFGKRSGLGSDEDARIMAAANACDIGHDYGQGVVPLYRSSLVVPFGTPARDVLDDLAQAMGGQWAYAQGQFFTRAGVYTAPVQTLTEADLATVVRDADGGTSQQAISISPHTARADKFNTVTPRIWDQAQNYKQVPLAPVKAAALITADGVVELVQEVDMAAVFYSQQAQHIAGVMMRDARDPLTVRATFKLSAYALELFDVVRLTIPRYGWADKTFLVMSRQWALGGAIDLTLKETAAAIYQPDAAFVPSGYADNTALPRPWDIAPPENLTASSGSAELLRQSDGSIITRVRVGWAAITDATLLDTGVVEVQWSVAADDLVWNAAAVTARETQLLLAGAPDGAVIIIRARTRNQLAVSDWGVQIVHTVVGKTEPPATVQAVTVSGTQVAWTPVADADLAGYRLRVNYGSDTWWDYAAPLHEGLITESPYTLERVPAGECTVLVKSVDTSGNESEAAAFAVYAFPEQSVANVLLSYAQHPTFPGTVTDGAQVAGELHAAALDSFYSPADGPLYLPSADPMYPPSQYAAMAYEFAVSPTEAGTLRVQATIIGANRVEYATGGADPLYTPTGDPLYSPADEALYGTPSDWQLWPGSLAVDGTTEVRFRIALAAGDVQGVISAITAVLDVPDITESLAAVAIGSAGTRLPITKTYHGIKTVALAVHSGGSGTSARIVDKDAALGPLIQVINTSGSAVAGTVDAQIQGY